MIHPQVGFIGSLILTLCFLGFAAYTGFKARRKQHLPAVAGSVLMLVSTIYFAVKLGELYDLESAGWITPVHMAMARVNTAAYLLPLLTGILTIKNPKMRFLHGRIALTILVFTVGTAVSGALMLYWSTPLQS